MSRRDRKEPRPPRPPDAADRLPKLCGGDIELGNFVLGLPGSPATCHAAAQALLDEIRGFDADTAAAGEGTCATTGCAGENDDWQYAGAAIERGCGGQPVVRVHGRALKSQDWQRKFLAANGGCAYIDLGHLELCLPEVRSAFDHVAAWGAMLRIARDALYSANARLSGGLRIQCLVNNSDGRGNSYGSHMDFLVTRRCWNNLFHRKLHQMLYLASYLASSVVFTGAGKVGSENARPHADFQLSQRADFFETLTGVQTTYRRPIVNSRDESLCGSSSDAHGRSQDHRKARLHVIFFDNTLCQTASFLKVGVTQLVLAMIEQEQVSPGLILDSPLRAVVRWSHDASLSRRMRCVSGRDYTAVELQSALLERASRFVAAGRADGIVPDAEAILAAWGRTLDELRAGDLPALAAKLDWALKRTILQQAIDRRGLTWTAPEIKYLDHLYSSLDPAEGLYWAFERDGLVRKVVPDGRIERLKGQPPDDTRAWLRAQLLRRLEADEVVRVDWDALRVRLPRNDDSWSSYRYFTLAMTDPLGFTRARCRRVLARAAGIEQALTALGAVETTWSGKPLDERGWASARSASASADEAAGPAENQIVLLRDVSRTGLNPYGRGGRRASGAPRSRGHHAGGSSHG